MIASPLGTIPRNQLFPFLDKHIKSHEVYEVVIGKPTRMSGEPSAIEEDILAFINTFESRYPNVLIHRINEAFTSKIALNAMIQAGSKKKDRRKKENIDKIAATIILQDFLEQKRNQL